jgi:hypothetical protein
MATNGLVSINKIVDSFLFKYEQPLDRAWIYLQHACDAVRELHLYDLPNMVTEKVTIDANGIIEFPTDMIGFNGLYKYVDGAKWRFTKRDDVIVTTTTTGGVEGQDDDYGEGEALTDPKTDTYGGVGGVNDYYYNIDWKARRIFCEGILSDTAILEYVTSGIELTGGTYIPDYCTPVIDAYLQWKMCFLVRGMERYISEREKSYLNAENRVRNLINAMSYTEWRDLLLSITTMSPLR